MGPCRDLPVSLLTLASGPGALPIFRAVLAGYRRHECLDGILVPLVLWGHFGLQNWSQPWAIKEPASLTVSRSFLRRAPHIMGPRLNPKLGPHSSTDSSEMTCQLGSFNHWARAPQAPSSIGLLGHMPTPDHAQRTLFPGALPCRH